MTRNKFWVAALFLAWPACAQDGAALYDQHCATCHQANGGGVPFINPPLKGSAIVAGDAESLALWVLLGNDAADANYESDYTGLMPGFKQLSDAEIAAILTQVRTEFSEDKTPVEIEDVQRSRAAL